MPLKIYGGVCRVSSHNDRWQ